MTGPVATFDADAARAARQEAGGDPFVFQWNGEQFTLPPAKEWPLSAVSALAEAKITTAMETLLGDQYPAFTAGDPRLADVEGIFEAVSEWKGGNLPE